jgi:hypothetical protein
MYFISSLHATCTTSLILHDLITLIIFGKGYKLWSPICAVFSSLVLLPTAQVRYSQHPVLNTPLVSVLPSEAKVHTHSKSFFFLNRLFTLWCRGVFTCESIRQWVGLLGWVFGQMQGLYLHTGQHNTEKHRHTPSSCL